MQCAGERRPVLSVGTYLRRQAVLISGNRCSSVAIVSSHQWSSVGSHQRSSAVIGGHQWTPEAIRGHQWQSGAPPDVESSGTGIEELQLFRVIGLGSTSRGAERRRARPGPPESPARRRRPRSRLRQTRNTRKSHADAPAATRVCTHDTRVDSTDTANSTFRRQTRCRHTLVHLPSTPARCSGSAPLTVAGTPRPFGRLDATDSHRRAEGCARVSGVRPECSAARS